MGLRFYRRIKILPGVTLNVGKTGITTTIGGSGAHVTYGHGKTRTTVGLPGTGISYSSTSGTSPGRHPAAQQPGAALKAGGSGVLLLLLILLGLIALLASHY